MRAISGFAACLLLLAGASYAEGMKLEPGKWEFKTTSRMPMQPGPQQRTETQCLTEAELDPNLFMKGSQGCTISEAESDAGSMRWKMSCASPGGRMDGEAVVHSTGSAMQGSMKAAMTVNGQRMQLEQKWEGRRIGPCE